jgi:small-conductance mechanosensitive channel
MNEILSYELLGRTVSVYVTAAAILLGAIIVLEIFRKVALRLMRKRLGTETEKDPFPVQLVRRFLIPGLYLGAIYAALNVLNLPENVWQVLRAAFIAIITWYAVRFLVASVGVSFSNFLNKSPDPDANRLKPLRAMVNLVIWVVGVLFLLSNLGFDITTIVAGLGIGGIAIALAAQAMLGDLFSYFVIFTDKPFEVGDFVIFDDVLGTIEKVGLKTTHIRSLSGEQIIVSNSQLTSAKVRNYKRMEERRILFRIGVTYDTGSQRIREIPGIIRGIIEADSRARFDRCHFAEYGDSSLLFETVYYVLSPDYTVYMDVQHDINLAIYDAFEERDIEFAFPTRTLYVHGAGATAGNSPGGTGSE